MDDKTDRPPSTAGTADEAADSRQPADRTLETADTEGHYLASYEYGRIVANERKHEVERGARESRLARESKQHKKR